MHFITGGAFNGKRAWVKRIYGISNWITAYKNTDLPNKLDEFDTDLLVLEGVEIWLKQLTERYDSYQCQVKWNQYLNNWMNWEKEYPKRKLIVIGTDISKGIVPMESESRLWRDVTGWAYQDLAAKADRVDIIWYGLNQTIKGKGEMENETLYKNR